MFTATGTLRCAVVLSPIWPHPFQPQAATVPSERSAKLCRLPAAMATTVLFDNTDTPGAVFTATGTSRDVVVLSPIWP